MSFHSVKKITITYKEYIDIKSMLRCNLFQTNTIDLEPRSRQYGIPQ